MSKESKLISCQLDDSFYMQSKVLNRFELENGVCLSPPQKIVVRKPVTCEVLAKKIADAESTDEEEMLFFESIKRVIYLNIHRHGYYDTRREFEDLVSETYTFLRGVLKCYDPTMGTALVTWAWKVIFTHTITQRRYYERYRKTQKLADDDQEYGIETFPSSVKDSHLAIDFRDAIKILHERSPTRRNILNELFGNPYEDGYNPPDNVNFSQAARNLGIPMQIVRSYCQTYVYPFLANRFPDYQQ